MLVGNATLIEKYQLAYFEFLDRVGNQGHKNRIEMATRFLAQSLYGLRFISLREHSVDILRCLFRPIRRFLRGLQLYFSGENLSIYSSISELEHKSHLSTHVAEQLRYLFNHANLLRLRTLTPSAPNILTLPFHPASSLKAIPKHLRMHPIHLLPIILMTLSISIPSFLNGNISILQETHLFPPYLNPLLIEKYLQSLKYQVILHHDVIE